MKRLSSVAVAIVVALAIGEYAHAASCESLKSIMLPNTIITFAQIIAAGQFTPPAGRSASSDSAQTSAFKALPPFCRVAATVRPVAGSEIQIEVWLPQLRWNGKFLATGNGAWGGSLSYTAMAAGVGRGYATASTDTGHQGPGASFATGNPEKVIDFAERAVHEMTMKGKALVVARYANPARYAYFEGCSTGGRQALTAAQRYADDFDGIVAGAPGNYTTRQAFGQVWIAQAMHESRASTILAAKLPMIHSAVVKACDALDGVKDGVLEDPTRCTFDPKVLECAHGDGPSCLTTPQIEAVRRTYAGARQATTREPIFPGLERGSELGWGRWSSAQPADYATEFFKYLVFKNPAWDVRRLNFHRDLAVASRAGAILDATSPDLKKFVEHRGKLLLYAGWSDPGIPPRNVVNYYNSVMATTSRAADSVRLFMVPGMAHCGGGDGTSTFDMLGALEDWIEEDAPPTEIIASRITDGRVDRTRPLCPYPKVAVYKGSGSTDDATNFACR